MKPQEAQNAYNCGATRRTLAPSVPFVVTPAIIHGGSLQRLEMREAHGGGLFREEECLAVQEIAEAFLDHEDMAAVGIHRFDHVGLDSEVQYSMAD
jgi:hypothetical protein